MNTTRIMIVGLCVLFTLLSGVWLSHLGRPLNVPVFTIHKLIALGTVILLSAAIHQLRRNGALNAPSTIAVIVTGLLVLSLFVSGALLSTGRQAGLALLTVHRVAPLLAAISAASAISLLAYGGIR